MKSNPLISVIVPIYMSEEYLGRCIESICLQSYSNLEIILINDGSTDRSLKICRKAKDKDARIVILDKKNTGASDSRNMALDICKGTYITFVDSDDYVDKDMIKNLLDAAVNNHAQVAICGFSKNLQDGDKDYYVSTLGREEALERMMYQKTITASPWAKLYHRKLFLKTRYVEGNIATDFGTMYRILAECQRVALLDYIGYNYTYRSSSIINSSFKRQRMDGLKYAEDQYLFIKKNYPALVDAAKNRYFMEAVFIISTIPSSGSKYTTEYNVCAEVIKRFRTTTLFNKRSRPIYRLYAASSFIGIRTLVRAIGLKNNLKLLIDGMKETKQ